MLTLASSQQGAEEEQASCVTNLDTGMSMTGLRRGTGLMQAELQRQSTAIAGIEASIAANNRDISELSLSYSQLTERVEKDRAAQQLLKRLAGWSFVWSL